MNITSKAQLKKMSGPQLVELYNSKAEKTVKRFSDKPTAIDKCWELLKPPVSKKKAAIKARSAKRRQKKADRKAGKKVERKVSKNTTTKKKDGVVARICELILQGANPHDIIDKHIRKEFPESNAKISAVYWCRSKLRKEGELE